MAVDEFGRIHRKLSRRIPSQPPQIDNRNTNNSNAFVSFLARFGGLIKDLFLSLIIYLPQVLAVLSGIVVIIMQFIDPMPFFNVILFIGLGVLVFIFGWKAIIVIGVLMLLPRLCSSF